MDYGKIVSGTFGVIWKEKKLWLFGIIGLLLSALTSGLFMAWYFNWYGNFISNLMSPGFIDSDDPAVIIQTIIGNMGWLFGGMSFMFCASLIGYVINLVMRGGTISEADLAWEGESVDIGRGTRNGAGHGLYLFIVDLLWWLLPAVLIGVGMACGFLFLFGGIGLAANTSSGEEGTVFAIMGSIFAFVGVLACLGFLISILQGVFAPLMYQSVVLGKHSIGAAISEGFNLARRNIGPMVIFLIIMFVLNLGVQFLIQMASLPLMGGWMAGWVGMIRDISSEGGMPSMSGTNGVLLFFGGLLLALATLLGQSFMQTFSLTMYARVYRLLTHEETAAEDAPQLSSGDELAVVE